MTKYIAVFCGSSNPGAEQYAEAAKELGKEIVKHGYGLVFGGGNVGLMKILADAVVQHHGDVIGVVTQEIVDKGVLYPNIDVYCESDYDARKKAMTKLAEGFIVLPGGLGTLDEASYVMLNNQFASYKNTPDNPVKPIGVYNANGFFDSFKKQLKQMFDERFMSHKHLNSIYFSDNISNVITYVTKFESPTADATRWWEDDKPKKTESILSPVKNALNWGKNITSIQNTFSGLFSNIVNKPTLGIPPLEADEPDAESSNSRKLN